MDALQFSLFFVALVIGYILVHFRLVRCEQHLREIVVLRQLNDRLRGVADAMDKLRIDRVLDRLEGIHEELRGIGQQAQRIEKVMPSTVAALPPVLTAPPEVPLAQRLRSSLEARLGAMGYDRLRILSDMTAVRPEEPTEIVIECERQRMPHKGKAIVLNGNVQELQIQSAAPMFP